MYIKIYRAIYMKIYRIAVLKMEVFNCGLENYVSGLI